MPLSASERINLMLTGSQICPFDWINLPLFYDPRPQEGTEYTRRLRAATKVAYVAGNEMSGGLPFLFRPSAMSNGALAYDLVNDCTGIQEQGILSYGERRFGRPVKTTQNLKNTVSGTEMLNRIIMPNRETDFRAANKVESRFPDMSIVVPIEFENVPRTQRSSNALSQGATFQDWTFENWWGPRVLDSAGLIYGGARRYESRYLCIEDLLGDMIQCGLLDGQRTHSGPGRDFRVVDEAGRDVPFADRAWGRAKHVFERTEQDFATDLAIATLLAQFALDDWLRGEGAPAGFDLPGKEHMHPVMAQRSKDDLRRMDRLKAIMIPYIAEKCLDFVPYLEDPNLKKYVEEKVLPAREKFANLDLAKARQVLFSEKIIGDINPSDLSVKKKKTTAAFDAVAANDNPFIKPDKRRSTLGNYFAAPACLFDDGHFGKLSLWEQAALPFLMGAMESTRLPESAPRSAFYVAEPKGGAAARAYMQERGLNWLKESYAAGDQLTDESFIKKVMAPNLAALGEDRSRIAESAACAARSVRSVVSTQNFLNIAAAVEANREFVAADGPQKLSPRGRLALMMEWLDRNPEMLVVRKDWDVHHDEAQLVLRALQIATGLVSRPYRGGDFRMEIFTLDQKTGALQKQDFHSLFMTLGRTVESMLGRDDVPPAREHYLAMSRMIQLLDMYADPGRMNYTQIQDRASGAVRSEEIIRWRETDPALMGFWHDDPARRAELMDLRGRLRADILARGVLHFEETDLSGLHEDFRAAWQEANGLVGQAGRRRFGERGTVQKWNGPV